MLTAAILLSSLLTAAPVDGVGPRVESVRTMMATEAVTVVEVAGTLRLEVREGASGLGVTVVAEANLQPLVEVSVQGNTLRVATRGQPISKDAVVVIVTMPAPSLLRVTGPAEVRAVLRGAASIEASGASRVVTSGRPGNLAIKARGATSINTATTVCDAVTVDVGGAAEVEVGAGRTLAVTGNGVGRVRYRGNPQVTTTVSATVKVTRVRP